MYLEIFGLFLGGDVSGLMGDNFLVCGKGVPSNGKKTSSYKSNIKKPTK
jgi:hypothetical protein